MLLSKVVLFTQISCSVEECQKRWKCIRDRYVRKLKKVKKKKTEDGLKDVYTSTWTLYPLLTFLNASVRHRKCMCSS